MAALHRFPAGGGRAAGASCWRSGEQRGRGSRSGIGIGGFLLVVVVWDLITAFRADQAAIPAFAMRGRHGAFHHVDDRRLHPAISPSASPGCGRISASVVIAVPIGILMSCYRGVGAFTEPLIDFIRYLPVPALVPLTLIWLGIGEELENRAPVDRDLLPACPAGCRRCPARADRVHRDRPHARCPPVSR